MKKFIAILLCTACIALPGFAKPQLVKKFTPGTQGTVLLFVASMCPCTDAHRIMVKNLMNEMQNRDITFTCVFSNEGETRVLAEHFFKQIEWDMPYVLDSKGKLAIQYGATNTPQAIVLDGLQQMVYRGPIDDSNRNLGRVKNAYLQNALHDVVAGQPVQMAEVTPTGCWIVRR